VEVNNAPVKKGEWLTNNDDYGKEVPVWLTISKIRIERLDGIGLQFFMVGIFSTATDCSGAFDWS
jgi:hypothetical protein